MSNNNIANLLPSIFRTKTNRKFLNATIDQLMSKPDIRKVNGYIGRTFAPTYNVLDNYNPEPSALRQHYQLEPSVVVTDANDNVKQFSSYIDLIEQIQSEGGLVNDHSRLFSGETYSFDGLVDFDKLVNFNQYYWLPDGPDTVQIFSNEIIFERTFKVVRDENTGSYYFSFNGSTSNPVIKLAHGGVYKFEVNQPGHPFWIQTEPGVSGVKENQPNISTRAILGVENNGTDVGVITFRVPQANAQDYYVAMPTVASVDYAVEYHYSDIQNKLLTDVINMGGFDGVTGNLINKSIIFANEDLDDTFWERETLNELYGVSDVTYYSTKNVPLVDRRGSWRIKLVNTSAGQVVHLVPDTPVAANQKVFIRSGLTKSQTQYYVEPLFLTYKVVPEITAPLANLYYQDGTSSELTGSFRVIESTDTTIDVEGEIIGRQGYLSPNGVQLTNGLKIQFDEFVTPNWYAGNTYYVEGVGKAIRLVDVRDMELTNSFADDGLQKQDYFTINRSSIDGNVWSRSNRWFHVDVINKTAEYNKAVPFVDQTQRANRPIIEYYPDIQLLNHGRQTVRPIDIIDFNESDAFSNIELSEEYVLDGVRLVDGIRVIFANDLDPDVKNKIYNVSIHNINDKRAVHLTLADDYEIKQHNSVIVRGGTNRGLVFHYDGIDWITSQQKTKVNQYPLFDVVDTDGRSFSDTTYYPNSSFAGTSIFTYKVGIGRNDNYLGFPLSYKNFDQIGDIEFNNRFDTETFTYAAPSGIETKYIRTGGLRFNASLTDYTLNNIWVKNFKNTSQFQVINSQITDSYRIEIDVLPIEVSESPTLRVFINGRFVSKEFYAVIQDGIKYFLEVSPTAANVGDLIDILIDSETVSEFGYYQVPINLEFNSENRNFDSMSLGQLRNHLSVMTGNSVRVVGDVPGGSNIRDIQIKKQGGTIVQHASPVIYSNLFLTNKQTNFIHAIEYCSHEYSKIKNKILELAVKSTDIDMTDIPTALDKILFKINSFKNRDFPWYASDMVPYGDSVRVLDYEILDAQIRTYEISEIYDQRKLRNAGTIVYLNRKQLVKDYDFVFDTNRSGITLSEDLFIEVGDSLQIYEYDNTDGNYIPETPTKLGLYPKFTPAIIDDDTYQTPTKVIRGHDGSVTPVFGDFRDELLLEFELRIYNNIKVDYTKNDFDVYDFLPGKFRETEYSREEFTQIISSEFLRWAGSNKINYSSIGTFQNSNAWTWNYKRFIDTIDGENLPGTWRAIFYYFYDTDRPNTHPWEMLGFSEEPNWWVDYYGPAPYTSGNLVLWKDLEMGLIRDGERAGIDARFKRPGLLKIIPVDESGILKSPEQYAVFSYSSDSANISYAVGDFGPAEVAWKRSSDYPFAVQKAIALMKPAYYFGTLMNVGRYYKNEKFDQYLLETTLQRMTPEDVTLNGYINLDGSVDRVAGYVNFVTEYIKGLGINPYTSLLDTFKNVSVRLAYKMAGFTDKSMIEVLAEQSSPTSKNSGVVIPAENYKLIMHKSTPVDRISYSAVIVEQTGNGYTVSGYNIDDPYFTIIPSIASNNSYTIDVDTEVGIIFKDFQDTMIRVPYGFEFTEKQAVIDFLVSYERYLVSVGFDFSQFDNDLEQTRDFKLSVREFLSWAQQGWNTGAVIVLSPVNNVVRVITDRGVVDQIENRVGATRIIDINSNYIRSNQFSVYRFGRDFEIVSNYSAAIGLVVFDIVEYEHVLVFDNKTIFDDVIFEPELGDRQYRLKLVGNKTGSWTGEMNPPGFIYNSDTVDAWVQNTDYRKGTLVQYKNLYYVALVDVVGSTMFEFSKWSLIPEDQIKTGLLPNFTYNATQFTRFFDIDDPETLRSFEDYSSGAIGFRPRQYMTDFGINKISQVKFYQGFVREKGTQSAIDGFTAADFNNVTSQVDVYEEWAVRVGEYGAIENNKFVEVHLDESVFTSDPVIFKLTDSTEPEEGVVLIDSNTVYKKSNGYAAPIYNNRGDSSYYMNDTLSAGYVHPDDVDAMIYDISYYIQLNQYLETMGIGFKVWTAVDFRGQWNVYRVSDNDTRMISMSASSDNTAVIATNKNHNLIVGDLVLLNKFDARFNGVYQVTSVPSLNKIIVAMYQNINELKYVQTITGNAPLYKFQSLRVSVPTDLSNIVPQGKWRNNDKIWVDKTLNGSWAVYNKSTPWSTTDDELQVSLALPEDKYVADSGFGKSVVIANSGKFAVAGMPNVVYGVASLFVESTEGKLEYSTTLSETGVFSKYGFAVDCSDTTIVVSAPGDEVVTAGHVFVYSFDPTTNAVTLKQTITSSESSAGDSFGYSVTISEDDRWLYVSAPKLGKVYTYYRSNTTGLYVEHTIIEGSSVVPGWTSTYRFGHCVKCNSNGTQLLVSSPYETVGSYSNAGRVYVFHRTVERSVASGASVYTTQYPITTDYVQVRVENVVVDYYTVTGSYGITFDNPPIIGSTVEIYSSAIRLAHVLSDDTPSSGSHFGETVALSDNYNDIYVSCTGYSEQGYYGGVVYRYTNLGQQRKTIETDAYEPTLISTDDIVINGVRVVFSGGDLTTVVSDINNANIDGVIAEKTDFGTLKLSSSLLDDYIVLNVEPGVNPSTFDTLGLKVYTKSQTIKYLPKDSIEQFGYAINVDRSGDTLVISGAGGTSYKSTSFDNGVTTFDNATIDFMDGIVNSGCVYVYSRIEGAITQSAYDQLVYVQSLENTTLSANDYFGSAVDTNGTAMLVGAPGDDSALTFDTESGLPVPINGAGRIYLYTNPTQKHGWDLHRVEQPMVDIDSITRLFLYDREKQSILTNLDYIDPFKGKILGVAEQDIDFKTHYDPAVYNTAGSEDYIASDVSVNYDYHWGQAQIGMTWWNTGAVRYMHYEQGSSLSRAANWGRKFPGSNIVVCEWVVSSKRPSQYSGDGEPLYPDDSAYIVENYVDPTTKIIKTRFYYWVKNKRTVDDTSIYRRTSVYNLQSLIDQPENAGIPYAMILAADTVALHGVGTMIKGNNTVLHCDYDILNNTNIIHSEYQLLQENSPRSLIPRRIINAMLDSLAGENVDKKPVPNPQLAIQDRTGIETGQSIFVNRNKALRNWIDYVNRQFSSVPVVFDFIIDPIKYNEPEPTIEFYDISVDTHEELSYIDKSKIHNGYDVLVKSDVANNGLWAIYQYNGVTFELQRVQKDNVPLYWNYVNWNALDYDSTMRPTYTVNVRSQVASLPLNVNDTVKIRNDGDNKYSILRMGDDGKLHTVSLQDGTIRLNDRLLEDTEEARYAIRVIFNTLLTNIFVESLDYKFNEMFFYLVNYILTEQKQVDWIFKTSFISVVHKIARLQQLPNYVKDSQAYYEGYINEVKPYRTSIREYLLNYSGEDTYYHDATDFDVPSTYDNDTSRYISPDIRIPYEKEYLMNTEEYRNWRENYSYSINEVLVSRTDSGDNTLITALQLFYDTPVETYAGETVTQLRTQKITLESNIAISAGNVVTQPVSGASGIVAIGGTDTNVIYLTDVSGFFATFGNSYITDNSANTSVRVTSADELSEGANGIVYSDSVSRNVTLYNVDGEFTLSPVGELYFRDNSGAVTSSLGSNIVTINTYTVSTGYFEEPVVIVEGGGGFGANIRAILNPQTNSIERFEVLDPGQGYTSTPKIRIDGTGGGASGYPVLIGQSQIDTLSVVEVYLDTPIATQLGESLSQPNNQSIGTVYSIAASGNVIVLRDVSGTIKSGDYLYTATSNTGVKVIDTIESIRFENNSYNKVRTFNMEMKLDRIGAEVIPRYNVELSDTITANAGDVISQRITYTVDDAIINYTLLFNYPVANVDVAHVTVTTGIDSSVLTDITHVSGQFKANAGNIYVNGVDTNVYVIGSTVNGYIDSQYNTPIVEWEPLKKFYKYDVVSYGGNAYSVERDIEPTYIVKTSGNVSVNLGDVITQVDNVGYEAIVTQLVSDTVFYAQHVSGTPKRRSGNLLVNGVETNVVITLMTDVFDLTAYNKIDTALFNNALCRTMAAYMPTVGMTGKDLTRLMDGLEYPGVLVQGVPYNAVSQTFGNTSVITYNPVVNVILSRDIDIVDFSTKSLNVGDQLTVKNYSYNIVKLSGEIAVYRDDIITQESNTVLSTTPYIQVVGKDSMLFPSDTASDFTVGDMLLVNGLPTGVFVTEILPIQFLARVINVAVDEIRVNIFSRNYSDDIVFDYTDNIVIEHYDTDLYENLDSVIQSFYTDSALGTRPEDINIEGGAYYDTYSSHAPEEMMPGIIFDNLMITVMTKIKNGTDIVGYRIDHPMNCNVSSSDTSVWPIYYRYDPAAITQLREDFNIGDSEIKVVDASVLTPPNPQRTKPGVIYINGEKIHYYVKDDFTNTLSQLRRAVDGTGAPDVHKTGSEVIDTNDNQRFPMQDPSSPPIGHAHRTTWLNRGITTADYIATENDEIITTEDLLNEFITNEFGNISITDGSGIEGSNTIVAKFIRREI